MTMPQPVLNRANVRQFAKEARARFESLRQYGIGTPAADPSLEDELRGLDDELRASMMMVIEFLLQVTGDEEE
jgi:hypothetical protein